MAWRMIHRLTQIDAIERLNFFLHPCYPCHSWFYFFWASRNNARASAMAVMLVGMPLRVLAKALKFFSACSRYFLAPVLAQRRTRLRVATLLAEGWAPSCWSLARAKSFS